MKLQLRVLRVLYLSPDSSSRMADTLGLDEIGDNDNEDDDDGSGGGKWRQKRRRRRRRTKSRLPWKRQRTDGTAMKPDGRLLCQAIMLRPFCSWPRAGMAKLLGSAVPRRERSRSTELETREHPHGRSMMGRISRREKSRYLPMTRENGRLISTRSLD